MIPMILLKLQLKKQQYMMHSILKWNVLIIYDPNDVARTTQKKWIIQEYCLVLLKGHQNYSSWSHDVAKTTIKETIVYDYVLGNLKGHEQITIYDPNDAASDHN
jgi:hypothetical protein